MPDKTNSNQNNSNNINSSNKGNNSNEKSNRQGSILEHSAVHKPVPGKDKNSK